MNNYFIIEIIQKSSRDFKQLPMIYADILNNLLKIY